MTEGSGLFLAGPALVKAAIGQKYVRRGAGRRDHARRDLRHRRLQGAERPALPRASALAWSRSSVMPRARPSIAPTSTPRGRPQVFRPKTCTRCIDPDPARPRQRLRHARADRPSRRSLRVRRVQARLRPHASSAATRASAASPSASSPTRRSTSRRSPRPASSASSSAASSTPRAPTRPPASSWTATRTSSR